MAILDDHAMEVIRKSGEQVVAGSKTDYFLKTSQVNSLVKEPHDFISLSYTGDNLTSVTYKNGGAGGTTVATLTLAYTGDRLDSVTKA